MKRKISEQKKQVNKNKICILTKFRILAMWLNIGNTVIDGVTTCWHLLSGYSYFHRISKAID